MPGSSSPRYLSAPFSYYSPFLSFFSNNTDLAFPQKMPDIIKLQRTCFHFILCLENFSSTYENAWLSHPLRFSLKCNHSEPFPAYFTQNSNLPPILLILFTTCFPLNNSLSTQFLGAFVVKVDKPLGLISQG